MALVNYSSSSESSDTEEETTVKKLKVDESQNINRRKKFPPPNFIKFFQKSKEDSVVDCPEEHDGRIRSFEHVRGNWASFVYISVKLDFNELQNAINDMLKNSKVDLKCCNPNDIHISLTKTLILHHHWIDSFSESILELFQEERCFTIRFGSLNIYTNEEKTRTFIGLAVEPRFSFNLKRLTDRLDKILEEYRLEKFYSEPLYHASILWSIGDTKDLLKSKSNDLQKLFDTFFEIQPNDFMMKVEKIYIKIGNKQYNCSLIKS